MNIQQFKKWLAKKRDYLDYVSNYYEETPTFVKLCAADIATQASQHAADLRLHELMRDWEEQPEVLEVDKYLVECLAGIPSGEVLTLKEAAEYLGYSESGLRKIKDRKEIKFAQKGQGPIKFQKEWLDEFLQNQQEIERSPVQKRSKPITIEPNHGFDVELFQADAHKGSE